MISRSGQDQTSKYQIETMMCHFFQLDITLLDCILSTVSAPKFENVEKILNWLRLIPAKEVQRFPGFANYYIITPIPIM